MARHIYHILPVKIIYFIDVFSQTVSVCSPFLGGMAIITH